MQVHHGSGAARLTSHRPVLGLLGGIVLGLVLVVIAPPLDAGLVLALAVIALHSKLRHRDLGAAPFVLLGMASVTAIGMAFAFTQ